MRLVPKQLVKQLEFYETRIPRLTEHAEAIGLSEAEVEALHQKAQAARAAFRAQQAAINKARAATLEFNLAMKELAVAGASSTLKIRATAEATGDRDIYSLAALPPPATPTAIDAPGTPYLPRTALNAHTLILRWKCDNPRGSAGTMYKISRQIVGQGEIARQGGFVFLDNVGVKRFVDETIPAGATQIVYRIQAFRSTKTGNAAEFNVNFGTNGIPMPPGLFTTPGQRAA